MNVKFIIHVSFLLNIQNSLNILIYMYDEYSKATKKHPLDPTAQGAIESSLF